MATCLKEINHLVTNSLTGLHLNWTKQKFTITRIKTYKGYNFAFLAKSVSASTSIQGYTCNMQVI